MQYLYPINAIYKDSKTVILLNDEEAVKHFIGQHNTWRKKNVNEYRKSIDAKYIYAGRAMPRYEYITHIYDWILRDDRGRVVVLKDFEEVRVSYWRHRDEAIQNAMKKGLPIPHTGKRKWHRHHAPYKKNGGNHCRAKADAKARYEEKEYKVPFKRLKYEDSWSWSWSWS